MINESTIVDESTCKHCRQPIKLVKAHRFDEKGLWYHVDGHRAYLECRNLKAEPIEEPAHE